MNDRFLQFTGQRRIPNNPNKWFMAVKSQENTGCCGLIIDCEDCVKDSKADNDNRERNGSYSRSLIS